MSRKLLLKWFYKQILIWLNLMVTLKGELLSIRGEWLKESYWVNSMSLNSEKHKKENKHNLPSDSLERCRPWCGNDN